MTAETTDIPECFVQDLSPPKEDGFYYDIPETVYRAWPLANASSVKTLTRGGTPAHYRHSLDYPSEDTDAKRFGRWAHMAVLEPARIEMFKPLPESVPARRGKDWIKLQADNPGVTFLPPSEWAETEGDIKAAKFIRDQVLNNPVACELLRGAKHEVCMVWTDRESGVRCKARIDILGRNGLGDVKTTYKQGHYEIARSGYALGYHIQSAMYTDGACKLLNCPLSDPPSFYFIYVEKEGPHSVLIVSGHSAYDERIVDVNPYGYLELGRSQYKDALMQIAKCQQSGHWEGYSMEPMDSVIPKSAGWEGH